MRYLIGPVLLLWVFTSNALAKPITILNGEPHVLTWTHSPKRIDGSKFPREEVDYYHIRCHCLQTNRTKYRRIANTHSEYTLTARDYHPGKCNVYIRVVDTNGLASKWHQIEQLFVKLQAPEKGGFRR